MTDPLYKIDVTGERVRLTDAEVTQVLALREGAADAAAAIPDRCTKLGLKRALAEVGPLAVFPEPEWPAVRALLASNPDLQEDWDLATEIRRADPLTQGFIAVRGYAPAIVDALLVRAVAIVA